jgi:hypothetical protein
MSNVLGDTKQQQVLALGRLGWSLKKQFDGIMERQQG